MPLSSTAKAVIAATLISLPVGAGAGWWMTDTYFGAIVATKQADLNTANANIYMLRASITSQNAQIKALAIDELTREARARSAQKTADARAASASTKAKQIMQQDPGADALISTQQLIEDSLK